MTRTAARKLAVQLCFAESAGGDIPVEEILTQDYIDGLPAGEEAIGEIPDEQQLAYIHTLVNGTAEKREELDGIISEFSRGWKINRISKTALAVLRCAIYEIKYMPDIPVSVAINEAIELCKEFDDTETVSFVNGILGSFTRSEEK